MRKLRFLLPSLLANDTSEKDVKIKRLVDFCILQYMCIDEYELLN